MNSARSQAAGHYLETIDLRPPVNMATGKILEDVLWTLHKAERTAEARTGTGGDQPDLRIYAGSGKKDTYDLLFSQVLKDIRAVRALAEEKKREFESSGWTR